MNQNCHKVNPNFDKNMKIYWYCLTTSKNIMYWIFLKRNVLSLEHVSSLLNIRIKIYELMQVMNNDNLPHVPNIVILFICD